MILFKSSLLTVLIASAISLPHQYDPINNLVSYPFGARSVYDPQNADAVEKLARLYEADGVRFPGDNVHPRTMV